MSLSATLRSTSVVLPREAAVLRRRKEGSHCWNVERRGGAGAPVVSSGIWGESRGEFFSSSSNEPDLPAELLMAREDIVGIGDGWEVDRRWRIRLKTTRSVEMGVGVAAPCQRVSESMAHVHSQRIDLWRLKTLHAI